MCSTTRESIRKNVDTDGLLDTLQNVSDGINGTPCTEGEVPQYTMCRKVITSCKLMKTSSSAVDVNTLLPAATLVNYQLSQPEQHTNYKHCNFIILSHATVC